MLELEEYKRIAEEFLRAKKLVRNPIITIEQTKTVIGVTWKSIEERSNVIERLKEYCEHNVVNQFVILSEAVMEKKNMNPQRILGVSKEEFEKELHLMLTLISEDGDKVVSARIMEYDGERYLGEWGKVIEVESVWHECIMKGE